MNLINLIFPIKIIENHRAIRLSTAETKSKQKYFFPITKYLLPVVSIPSCFNQRD